MIKNKFLLTGLIALCALIGIFFVFYMLNDVSTYDTDAPLVQYYADMKIELEPDSELYRNADNETILVSTSEESVLSSIALYYEGQQRLILPQDMIYYNPSTGERYRVDHFTELVFENGAVIAKRDGDSFIMNEGFLHDGEDYYIFVEPMTVEHEDYSIQLGPLSYVELVYQEHMMAFNLENEEFFIQDARGNVSAVPDNELYSLALVHDTVVDAAGQSMLLITRPEFLDRIFD